MTYAQAKLRIWNSDAYTAEQVQKAAVFIIGTIDASEEDLGQAYNLI